MAAHLEDRGRKSPTGKYEMEAECSGGEDQISARKCLITLPSHEIPAVFSLPQAFSLFLSYKHNNFWNNLSLIVEMFAAME